MKSFPSSQPHFGAAAALYNNPQFKVSERHASEREILKLELKSRHGECVFSFSLRHRCRFLL
jgi:hypothetical protein